MSRSFLFPTVIALLAQLPSYAQAGVRDTSIFMVPVTMSYSLQIPQGDMAERFGWNHNLAVAGYVKTPSNYLLGMEGGFMFGNNVKDHGMLSFNATSNGVIPDQEGTTSKIFLYQRGYTITVYAGKLLPIVGPNPNSGILLKLGGGYMRHKVRVESQTNEVHNLQGEYLKGYDRLTAGPLLSAYVGYHHVSTNKLVNFMFGFQMDIGFTQNLRPFQFDKGRNDDGVRFDGLNGLRVGWMLPIYKSRDDRTYFY